jgi:membrane fusion protein (multidrug efflux system)
VDISVAVAGYVQRIHFREGQSVSAGDLLYTLDDREFRADLAVAVAALASAKAAESSAERNLQRGRQLLPQGAIAASEMDDLEAKYSDAVARSQGARAQVQVAQVNVDYTEVRAPIAGRIGRSLISVGDLVSPQSGPLTTLVSIDPIEAIFAVSETTYVASVGQSQQRETLEDDYLSRIEVTLELADGSMHPEVGHIDFFANRIDLDTGTLEARAVIPNPKGLLVAGQYVNVHLTDPAEIMGVFLPQAGVQVDQQGTFVLTVSAAGVVERQNVVLGERYGDWVVVQSGLEAGVQVITRGLQQVRPAMQVDVIALPQGELPRV